MKLRSGNSEIIDNLNKQNPNLLLKHQFIE